MAWVADRQLPYIDRREAGVELAKQLEHYRSRPDVVVLALPRGGVPVAYEVARALGAPLDIFVVRKLGLPSHREYAIGAIASGGVRIVNDDALRWYGISADILESIAREEEQELQRRERVYRDDLPPLDLAGQVVILVDDGLATGSTMRAAVEAIRKHTPAKVVVAVPVGSPDTCAEFMKIADEVACARTPEPFRAVGLWYRDFSETSDDEVRTLLHEERRSVGGRQ